MFLTKLSSKVVANYTSLTVVRQSPRTQIQHTLTARSRIPNCGSYHTTPLARQPSVLGYNKSPSTFPLLTMIAGLFYFFIGQATEDDILCSELKQLAENLGISPSSQGLQDACLSAAYKKCQNNTGKPSSS